MKSIALLIVYFGGWPEWMPLFLESVRANPTVDWIFITDCGVPETAPPNVRWVEMDFAGYANFVSRRLGIDFQPADPYKFCDLRPAFGYLHTDLVRGYDYFGYGDLDVIYGNIRAFYDEAVLSHDCISTHEDRVSGHLALFRNEERLRRAFKRMYRRRGMRITSWKRLFSDPTCFGLDEAEFSALFLPPGGLPEPLRSWWCRYDSLKRNNYFKEQHSTVLSKKPWLDGRWEHPETWFWIDGRLTNSQEGAREFLYLHFMNWKGSRWLDPRRGTKAAWEGLDRINYVPPGREGEGFRIDRTGFHPLD